MLKKLGAKLGCAWSRRHDIRATIADVGIVRHRAPDANVPARRRSRRHAHGIGEVGRAWIQKDPNGSRTPFRGRGPAAADPDVGALEQGGLFANAYVPRELMTVIVAVVLVVGARRPAEVRASA